MTILSPVQPAARRREAPAAKQLIPAIAADGSFYPIEKMDAHRRAVQHLAVSVFVFSDDELLLQSADRTLSRPSDKFLWVSPPPAVGIRP